MGVRVNTLGEYRLAADGSTVEPLPPALVLGFGNVDEDQIRQGIRTLAEAVRRQG